MDGPPAPGEQVLFVVRPQGWLVPVTDNERPEPVPGDTLVLLREP